jgi:geranylgeranyl pyrophosphate synthase
MSGGDAKLKIETEGLRAELRRLIPDGPLSDLHCPALELGGKMLRPRWTLLCAMYGEEAGGAPDWKTVRRAALAVELIHVGSLYHDDIVDRSRTRRGEPATYRRYGNLAAALGGAHLLALGNELAAGLPRRLRDRWGSAARKMANGQLRDIEYSGSFERSAESYVHNATRKTGSVFELAAAFGTVLGQVDPVEAAALTCAARHFGAAFQLCDDLEDFTSSSESHRARGNDLRQRTYTLPVLIACASQSPLGQRLRMLLEDDGHPATSETIDEICEVLIQADSFSEAARLVIREQERAITHLRKLRPLSSARAMISIVESLPVSAVVDQFRVPST